MRSGPKHRLGNGHAVDVTLIPLLPTCLSPDLTLGSEARFARFLGFSGNFRFSTHPLPHPYALSPTTDGCGIRLGNVHSRGTVPVTCTASTIHQGYPISNYAGGCSRFNPHSQIIVPHIRIKLLYKSSFTKFSPPNPGDSGANQV